MLALALEPLLATAMGMAWAQESVQATDLMKATAMEAMLAMVLESESERASVEVSGWETDFEWELLSARASANTLGLKSVEAMAMEWDLMWARSLAPALALELG